MGNSHCETCLGVVKLTLTAVSLRYENRVGMFSMPMKVVPRKTPQSVLLQDSIGVFSVNIVKTLYIAYLCHKSFLKKELIKMNEKIAFIGAGSMAEAIISGIVHKEILRKEQIIVTNKNNKERIDRLEHRYQIQSIQDKEKVAADADILILATKPYDLEAAVKSIKPYLRPDQLVISVIAGIATEYITELIGNNAPVIRAMPNTSASIGCSATALSAGKYAEDEHMTEAKALFETIGTTAIVAEADMHTVTGISGSGPAYIYYFVEAMEQAAVEAGLDQKTAKALVAQTVIGAGEMLKQTGESAGDLREKVTSPGGTTEAGLEALAANGFQDAVRNCVESARERSIELGKK